MNESLPDALAPYRELVGRALRDAMPDESAEGALTEAMSYSLFAGGKRIRPILTLLACEASGNSPEPALPIAAALEMIHTYSLIHDDLPCMDDDDLRRGRPTCHIAHGEATALLAGDALLTHAFAVAASATAVSEQARIAVIRELAAAAGWSGMIGGQILDLAAEHDSSVGEERLTEIHRRKTGALLTAAVVSGALVAGAPTRSIEALRVYGQRLGLVFQIADDLLDVTGNAGDAGKRTGKDVARGKATYPSIMGIPRSREYATTLVEQAVHALPFDTGEHLLARLAHFVIDRID